MTNWEYLIVSLAAFDAPKADQGASAAVNLLNEQGSHGWEAVGLTTMENSQCAVLMKRPLAQTRASGGRM